MLADMASIGDTAGNYYYLRCCCCCVQLTPFVFIWYE
jgi:hypothetical protein